MYGRKSKKKRQDRSSTESNFSGSGRKEKKIRTKVVDGNRQYTSRLTVQSSGSEYESDYTETGESEQSDKDVKTLLLQLMSDNEKMFKAISDKQDRLDHKISNIGGRMDKLEKCLNDQGNSVEFLHGEIDSIKKNKKDSQAINRDLNSKVSKLCDLK